MSSVAPATGGITTNTAKVPGGGGPKVANGRFTINLRQSGIYIAFAVIVLGFAIATDGKLLGFQNISNIIIQNSYILVLAIGMILIIIAGHIDLSVGSVVAATGGLAAVLMVNLDIPWPLAILITLVAGGVIGAWQGYWVAYFGIPAFIVTLAGMLLFRAVAMQVLGNQGVGPFPDQIRTLANGFTPGTLGNVALGPLGGADIITLLVGILACAGMVVMQLRTRQARIGYKQSVEPFAMFVVRNVLAIVVIMTIVVQLARFKNLPWVLVLLAVLVIGYTLVANRTVFGRHVYAIGGNLQAASLSGVKVKRVTFWLFVNMGVLAAVAGIILSGRLNVALPGAGQQFELDAIAAAFIGGAAVQGGVGRIVGAITGGLIMAVINNGMSLLGASPDQVMLAKGAVLLLAVALDVWAKRRAGASR
ncbi:multiple monosaccharide ABC transporter permease [Catenuloplanes japonicus]|uniref:multiple monosaccharide ABC transporter permease n=1 Tax=Catenuloplanes japonicus TaxID=33876 RepID=UPI000A4B4938|nr:multiple monosaccharide ABC transporter permease [Catenuloplanes japonicus]